MNVYIGLGSNLGNRAENLERAALELSQIMKIQNVAPIFRTAAEVKPHSPAEWNQPYFNSVVGGEFPGSARDLFRHLKEIEKRMGRVEAPRWSPRIIDLDLLLFGSETWDENDLKIPHPGLESRAFVLDPLKHIAPLLRLPTRAQSSDDVRSHEVLSAARALPRSSPLWMGILNLTPDSFSGAPYAPENFMRQIQHFQDVGVHVIDLGAESTRPGATPVTPAEEWKRLREPLRITVEKNKNKFFRPLVSVDTRHVETAKQALQNGADWINDVNGASDPAMQKLLSQSRCSVVAMHSLSVPARKDEVWPEGTDPISELKNWAQQKIATLVESGISLDRIILDPGIGFGKTAQQSLEILARFEELQTLPARWLVGHSRKSFMKIWSKVSPESRDAESVGLSLRLVEKHVDILRVHHPEFHIQAFTAWNHLLSVPKSDVTF